MNNILIIKLGALGDVIQALGPMRAIRAYHAGARITIMTTKPFAALLEKTGLFNDIIIDSKPAWYDIGGIGALARVLNDGHFDRVYDLQNNDRTFMYLRLLRPWPEWVGAAPGASHRNASPDRSAGHAFDGHVQTLSLAGIQDVRVDRLDWLHGDFSCDTLPKPYAVIVVGSAPKHTQKRWPHFVPLCKALVDKRVHPVLIGTQAEEKDIQTILHQVPEVISLIGQTQLWDLPDLARRSAFVIGNDTGPMHLMGPTGAKTIVLMGRTSNPKRHYPLGARVQVLFNPDLAAIDPDQVLAALDSLT